MGKSFYHRLASYVFWLFLFGLAAWLITPVMQRRPRGQRPPCLVNLHQIAIAIHNYAATYNVLPPQKSDAAELSWRVKLLPLVESSTLYRRYHSDKPWNDPANLEFAQTKLPWLICPDNPHPQDAEGRYYTAYALLTGPGTMYDGPEPRRFDDLSIGVSQTIMLVEACGANIVWNEPRDIDVSRDESGIDFDLKQISNQGWAKTYHGDCINVVFADGSCRSLSIDMDRDLLKKLSNIDPEINSPQDKTRP